MIKRDLVTFFVVSSFFLCASSSQAQPYACVTTNLGEFCMELLVDEAPNTVANFINYVEDGDYNDTLFHRSVPNFVIQGGGYYFTTFGEVPKDPTVINEFNVSNTRGTVAMAKFGSDPNSATSEWFVNLDNNGTGPALLDLQNGGFTVFARVLGNGMDVVDAIANLSRVNLSGALGSAFGEVPVLDIPAAGIGTDDFVQVLDISVSDEFDDSETIIALTEYSDGQVAFPVRVGSQIFQVLMILQSADPIVFSVALNDVVNIEDVAQDAASFDASSGILLIPSVMVGNNILTNVGLQLTASNAQTLQFTLQSFNN